MRNTLTKWMGVRIVLFENDGIPDIYGKGIKVQPGTETNIGVITNRLHKLKTPYKADCKTDWTSGFPYSWQPYSYPTCLEAVKQLGYLKYCKCYVIYGMLNGLIERNPLEFSWCTHDDRHCLKMVDEGFANHSILPTQDCRPRCDSIEFEVSSRCCRHVEFSYQTKRQFFFCRQIFQWQHGPGRSLPLRRLRW